MGGRQSPLSVAVHKTRSENNHVMVGMEHEVREGTQRREKEKQNIVYRMDLVVSIYMNTSNRQITWCIKHHL